MSSRKSVSAYGRVDETAKRRMGEWAIGARSVFSREAAAHNSLG